MLLPTRADGSDYVLYITPAGAAKGKMQARLQTGSKTLFDARNFRVAVLSNSISEG
jgi:hypothetical protein